MLLQGLLMNSWRLLWLQRPRLMPRFQHLRVFSGLFKQVFKMQKWGKNSKLSKSNFLLESVVAQLLLMFDWTWLARKVHETLFTLGFQSDCFLTCFFWRKVLDFVPSFVPTFWRYLIFNFCPRFCPQGLFAFSWDLETDCAAIKKDAFQRPWINWVIRLT